MSDPGVPMSPGEQLARDQLRKAIREHILDEFLSMDNPDDLSNDMSLYAIFEDDERFVLLNWVATKFSIRIDCHGMTSGHLDSVNRIAAFVERKRAEKGEAGR